MPNTALNVRGEATLLPRVVKLSWTLPTDASFDEIVVHRRTDDFQIDPLNPFGVEIYRGTATTIYDYHLVNPATTNFLEVPDIYDIIKEESGDDANFLKGETLYYYTVFALDNLGNYNANNATMVVAKPIKEYFMGQKLYNMLPEIYREYDTQGELKRFLEILGYMADFIYSTTKMLPDLLNIHRCTPEQLVYIASTIGWDLDKTLPVSIQRASLANAQATYKLAGTKRGLDKLVKYYSGFPKSSGVLEGFAFDQYSVYFGTSPTASPRYTDHVVPDFTDGAMDFDAIKTPSDPLHYTPDFSISGGLSGTDTKFFVYVQPYYELSESEKYQIELRVRRVLDQFKPLGVDYIFEFYDV
jgi:phage tail-like protein